MTLILVHILATSLYSSARIIWLGRTPCHYIQYKWIQLINVLLDQHKFFWKFVLCHCSALFVICYPTSGNTISLCWAFISPLSSQNAGTSESFTSCILFGFQRDSKNFRFSILKHDLLLESEPFLGDILSALECASLIHHYLEKIAKLITSNVEIMSIWYVWDHLQYLQRFIFVIHWCHWLGYSPHPSTRAAHPSCTIATHASLSSSIMSLLTSSILVLFFFGSMIPSLYDTAVYSYLEISMNEMVHQ